MSDLYYGSGDGSWSSYSGYPPSFDPNNQMGGGGYTPYDGTASPDQIAFGDYVTTVQHLSTQFDSQFFKDNFNSNNPYTKYFDIQMGMITWAQYSSIPTCGNAYQIIGYTSFYSASGEKLYDPIYRVYNNAYTEYEVSATSAQNEYLTSQTSIHNASVDAGRANLIASYGNIKDSSIASKIQQIGDLTAQYEKLKFEDDITEYLNRITDSDNAAELESLAQQINDLGNELFRELTDYWRRQENIRREQREFFGGFGWENFNWLTDPYFGRGGGEFYVGRNIHQSIQQNQHTFLNLYTSGDMGDWMAGGTMYDSPRAGNILFNPLGSLNTTVFLGLENQNFSPSLPTTLANPEVFRSFGTLAGDRGFSVLNFGIKK